MSRNEASPKQQLVRLGREMDEVLARLAKIEAAIGDLMEEDKPKGKSKAA